MSSASTLSSKSQGKSLYLELAEIVRERGWQERIPGRCLTELAFHLLFMLSGIAVFLLAEPLWLRGLGILMMAAGDLGIATNTHTSSHNATFKRQWANRAFTYFGYPFMFGAAATYWWNKHCVIHHPNTNLVGLDEDIDLMPWFAIQREQYEQSRGVRRFFYKIQWLFTPLAVALNTFSMVGASWRFLLPKLFNAKQRKAEHWIDLGAIALHWTCWVIVPSFFFPVWQVLAFYSVRMALMGYSMFAAFAPAHMPHEAVFARAHEVNTDYLLKQTATTVNFRGGWYGRFLCSGVDYQIEHHLFPGVPHPYYPKMSKVVQEFCERHGYPYRSLSWPVGIWKALEPFKVPKDIVPSLEALREVPAEAT